MTAADLVIQELAASEATLVDRVADLQHENSILRDLACESLHQLARLTSRLDASTRTIAALRERSVEPRRQQAAA